MNFQYKANLDDIAEVYIRQFIRTSIYKRNRLYRMVGASFGAGAILLIIKHYIDPEFSLWLLPIFILVSGVGSYFVYPDSVRKHIKKHLERELNKELPITTTYSITGKKVECNSLKVDISFEIQDLVQVTEDDDRIELSFAPKGLCVIPKRAFATPKEINQFKCFFQEKLTGSIGNKA